MRSAETRPAETSFTLPPSSGFAYGTTSLAAYGAARSGRSQPRCKIAPHDSRPGPTRCLQPITFALRLLAVVVTECTAASLPLPFPPFCFFRPPALSSGWGIMRSSASPPYAPWGAMCKSVCVCHLGGDKEVVAAPCSIAAASGQSGRRTAVGLSMLACMLT